MTSNRCRWRHRENHAAVTWPTSGRSHGGHGRGHQRGGRGLVVTWQVAVHGAGRGCGRGRRCHDDRRCYVRLETSPTTTTFR